MWKEALGPYLRHYPGICVEGLGETTKKLYQDSWSTVRDLNPELFEYEAIVLITRLRRSVWAFLHRPTDYYFLNLYY
jgi:hypothetical protein